MTPTQPRLSASSSVADTQGPVEGGMGGGPLTLASLLLSVEAQVQSRDPTTVRGIEETPRPKSSHLHSGKRFYQPPLPPCCSLPPQRGAPIPVAGTASRCALLSATLSAKLLPAENQAVGGRSSCAPEQEVGPPDGTGSGGGCTGLPGGMRAAQCWSWRRQPVLPHVPCTPTGGALLPKPGERGLGGPVSHLLPWSGSRRNTRL